MTDESKEQAGTSEDAQDGGQQSEKTFTQAQVDAIIAERLARQKAQFKDYDELKEGANKWQKFLDDQKSELQKLNEQIADAQRERDEALQQAQDRLIRAAFVAEAAKAGVAHPEDVYALADLSNVTLDEGENVIGVAEAVAAVVEAGRVPLAQGPRAPDLQGGTGSGQRPAEKKLALTQDEAAIADKLRISHEAYAARKQELEKQQTR